MKISVLDLSPVLHGHSPAAALQDSIELAKYVDDLGYYRYWFAEHHNMPGIAASSPEIMMARVACETKDLRVGSGGVMLPNHSPLKVAENFKTLSALYPGRIDLGIGRAPGTDIKTALVLRRTSEGIKADHFQDELQELLEYLEGGREGIIAMPGEVSVPEMWLLGSSDHSAKLAAKLGLPFSFAHHFSTYPPAPIFHLYRDNFRPSKYLARPHSMLGVHVICARTDEEAKYLSLTSDYSFFRLRQHGISEPLHSVEKLKEDIHESVWPSVRSFNIKKIVGSGATVKEKIDELIAETQADELIVTTFVYNQKARRESYRILKEQLYELII